MRGSRICRCSLPTLSVVLCGLLSSPLSSFPQEAQRPNVLFISIDDLRNDLGVFGVDHAHTPHLDAFAAGARAFRRHYTQVPSCGPSRFALLSGMRPSRRDHLPNDAIARTHEDWGDRSLPAWFHEHGYRTFALGKVSHFPGGLMGQGWADESREELPGAWDRSWVPEDSPWETPQDMMHGYADGVPRDRGESPPWEAHEGPDTAYPDGWVANEAMAFLGELAEKDQPWFFAVGFFKPHLPFAAPLRWFEFHDPDAIPEPPHNARRHPPPSSWHGSGEMMGNYGHGGRDPREDADYAKDLRHAYAAAASYVDDQVGRVLKTFNELGLAKNTVVVVWSDHGFHLGEHAIWGKHALYEESLKAPLMIYHPGIERPGEISEAIVETIDLYPTLTDLSGLPRPEGLDGRSLIPHLEDPGSGSIKPAIGYRGGGQRTIRVDDWRLILHPADETMDGVELFDFRTKPHGERVEPDEHEEIVKQLVRKLSAFPVPD